MANKKPGFKPAVQGSLFEGLNTINISRDLKGIYDCYKEDNSLEGPIITGLCNTIFTLLEVIERSLNELEVM